MAARASDPVRENLANCTENDLLSSTARFTNNTPVHSNINHAQIRLEGPKNNVERLR
jgi:hypothetical protein